jgi:putative aldouronate transport system permease protein
LATKTINAVKKRGRLVNRFELLDVFLLIILTAFALMIIVPFINVLAISFTTHKEYLDTPVLLFPKKWTLDNYKMLFEDGRIWVGYRTTLIFLCIGMPLNMILTTSMAYGLSRPTFPFKKFLVYFVIITMLFHGGIIPMYLLMKQLNLINKIWSVILASGMNSFYLIIMRNYFISLPESIMESAKLDGANEWRILLRIVLPISLPIIATITLFYSVDRWNEWFNPMIFIRRNDLVALQLVLRSMIVDMKISDAATLSAKLETQFSDGMKMAAVIVTMLPVMCIYPFLQKHFTKGIMIGAIKA